MIVGLINNVALLLSLGIVYEAGYYLPLKIIERHKIIRPAFYGLLIGIIGISIMSVPLKLFPEVTLDSRSILIGITALAYGALPTVIAAAIMSVLQIIIDGGNLFAGIAILVLCSAVGLLWRLVLPKARHLWINMLIFGLIIHLVSLACMLLFTWPQSQEVIKDMGIPLLIIYPIATSLLGVLLLRQKSRNEALIRVSEVEERYRSLFNNKHTPMMLVRAEDGKIIDVNPAACDFFGYPADTLVQMDLFQFDSVDKELISAEMQRALKGQKDHFLFEIKRKEKDTGYVEVFSGPAKIGDETLLSCIVHDITKRISSERALAESEARFRLLVERAPDAIFIQTNKKFAFVNKATIVLFGAKSAGDLIGLPVLDVIHPDCKAEVLRRINLINNEKKNTPSVELVFLRFDGSKVPVDVTAVPIYYSGSNGAIVFSRDISKRKQDEQIKLELEAQLRQQQKLEAIGTLAGGVAHEINNPINGIMNYAELLLDTLGSDSKETEYAGEIKHEAMRISVIVKNLLQFSRQEKQALNFASINEIVQDTVSLINTVIKKDQINLEVDLDGGLPEIRCRSQQIQQVLMNLLTNARDALNEKYPDYNINKIMRLSCSQFENNGQKWVRLIVKDYGYGIPDKIKEKVFEPFFSTKPKEKGTGLGLSISFGIIQDHHGIIKIDSKEGEFTKFIIELPVDLNEV